MLTELEIKELEESLIKSIVFDSTCIYNICEIIDPNDLIGLESKEIYTQAIKFISKNKEYDSLEIMDSVSEKSKNYIVDIQDTFITSAKVESVAKKLREYRDAKRTRQKITTILNEDLTAKDFVNRFERITFDLSQQKNGNSLINIWETGKLIKEKSQKIGDIEGYSWGLPTLDAVTGGIIPGKTYVIGGTKKTGKTKFVINTIYHLCSKEIKSLFFSLEMNDISVVRWLVSRFSKEEISTDNFRFKNPRLNLDQFEKVLDNVCFNDLINIDTRPGLSFLQIKNQVWRHLNNKVQVIFIDYLQRMYIDNEKDNRATAIQKTVGYLADMAKQYNIALVILSQLANIAEGQMGNIGHLKESGGIAENVDCIMILNNIDRIENNLEPSKKKNEITISIDQRDGESQLIKCYTKLQYNKFNEMIDADSLR